MALNKRQKAILAATQPGKAYSIDDALKILKDNSKAKFVEAIDVAVRLGVDAKKSDQQVRGSTVLPAGTGKSVRVAVFAPAGAKADEALAAGAEAVGMDDLAEKMHRRRPELRRGHRHAGRDARGRQARPGARPARPDAEPEGRHRVGEPGRSREQREGRPGALPHRQGRHHPLHHRQGELRERRAEGQPAGAADRPGQGQAGDRRRAPTCRRSRSARPWAPA